MSDLEVRYYEDFFAAVVALKKGEVDIALLPDFTQGTIITSTLIMFPSSKEKILRKVLPKTIEATGYENLPSGIVAEIHFEHDPAQVFMLLTEGIPFETQDQYDGVIHVEGPDVDLYLGLMRGDITHKQFSERVSPSATLKITNLLAGTSVLVEPFWPPSIKHDPNR